MSFINLPINKNGPTDFIRTFPTPKLGSLYREEVFKTTFSQFSNFEKYSDLEAPIASKVTKNQNGFFSTVHEAFANERPLVLSPTHIWTAITQAVSIHVNKNAEQLRHLFVSHQGKQNILVQNDKLQRGNPNSPWQEVFPVFDQKLREKVKGDFVNQITNPFSTSTPVSSIVQTITLMDTLQQYFEYTVLTMCGIPRIELVGTTEDWVDLVRRAESICQQADMQWWADELIPVLFHFVVLSTSPQDASVEFWRRIYRRLGERQSGAVEGADGWINVFFPYIATKTGFQRRNSKSVADQKTFFKSLTDSSWWQNNSKSFLCTSGIGDKQYPSGVCLAPFTWQYLGENKDMTLCGGFLSCVGSANNATNDVTPLLGWAVAHGTAK